MRDEVYQVPVRLLVVRFIAVVRLRAGSLADGCPADADRFRSGDEEGQQGGEAGRPLEDAVTVEQRHRQIGEDGQRRGVEEEPRYAADDRHHKRTDDLRRGRMGEKTFKENTKRQEIIPQSTATRR